MLGQASKAEAYKAAGESILADLGADKQHFTDIVQADMSA
jgi:hypothetical protein